MYGDVEVTTPARADAIHILRAVVASMAARMDFTVDRIDDLRLLLDEACGQILGSVSEATFLNLQIRCTDSALEVTVTSDGRTARIGADGDSMAWTILSALADELQVLDGDAPGIRLTRHRQAMSDASG